MSKRKLEPKAGCARSKRKLVEKDVVGGQVNQKTEALNPHVCSGRTKAPNLTCRVESFGRICQKFDERRKRWVSEMGFSGLLHLASGMHMPRQLAYWLLSRVDPIWKMLISPKGSEFKLSANQVHWILGIPNGGKCVPLKKNMRLDVKDQVEKLLSRYSYSWETKCTRYKGRAYVVKGIHVNSTIMDRVEGNWEENEEAEFKTLFLILSLHMVLFSTQSPRLSSDLLPALTCATECAKYDWCNLVLSKFLSSVSSFAKRLDATGNGGGSGGCLLFIVVFYLDRLIRDPLRWGTFPRITVWG
ncbi:uncharacterized protein LOC110704186 [Chenopodium quinoa]|uniref:uncharacterized protein LOC110704186 n=1 Tax=Chenopodium quinoa TaxID=63459 RepID=UPI000B76EA58|nr:uncharacterized protein LOC110704186 [Chenopodium quinoa]XP_021737668.1 uncharacterized protein LOC110704186 [Chenopodium quinoa]